MLEKKSGMKERLDFASLSNSSSYQQCIYRHISRLTYKLKWPPINLQMDTKLSHLQKMSNPLCVGVHATIHVRVSSQDCEFRIKTRDLGHRKAWFYKATVICCSSLLWEFYSLNDSSWSPKIWGHFSQVLFMLSNMCISGFLVSGIHSHYFACIFFLMAKYNPHDHKLFWIYYILYTLLISLRGTFSFYE